MTSCIFATAVLLHTLPVSLDSSGAVSHSCTTCVVHGLKSELLSMAKRDQEVRDRWDINKDMISEEVERTDSEHEKRLREIIQEYGWPGFSLCGEEGSGAMWLLVQHQKDIDFQKQCLTLLQEAVDRNDAKALHAAYLQDRVLVHDGKNQIYGTQLSFQDGKYSVFPIDDEEHVDERRKDLGLSSMEEYLQGFQVDEQFSEVSQ
jgi:hypothetical protein